MRRTLAGAVLALGVGLSGCAGTLPRRETGGKTVYVVHHGGLHTGLTIERSDIPRGHWPASADFGRFRYIEVGWGDDDGYRRALTSGIATKALLGDPQTVLFVDGFNQPPRRKYSGQNFTVLAVDLSDAEISRLCDHIQQSYASDENGKPIRLGKGWYRARGTFSVQHL